MIKEITSVNNTYIKDRITRNFISVDESGNYQKKLYTAASKKEIKKELDDMIQALD